VGQGRAAFGAGRSRGTAHARSCPNRGVLPTTPALRRTQINLQVALITRLFHVGGYSAPETKAAVEQARLLLEQAHALGESPGDPLLLFWVLYGFFAANFAAFHADVCLDLAAQFLALADKQKASFALMLGHGIMGASLLLTGDLAEARAHFDQGMALYDGAGRGPQATQFGEDPAVTIMFFRSKALWLLGYPEAALAGVDRALRDARESGHVVSLIWALIDSFFAIPLQDLMSGYYFAFALPTSELRVFPGR
jgi:hypothetical protein